MGDWTHGHACQILKKQLDYSQGRMRGDYPEVDYKNAVDKVCDESELMTRPAGSYRQSLIDSRRKGLAKRLETTIGNIKFQDYEVYRDDIEKLEYVLKELQPASRESAPRQGVRKKSAYEKKWGIRY